eukprot:TRINITY_DN328_c1_g2_i19.p2 TRINITY_DN328_c1_g2~~TRINITY_DN328_c1_g2_i19.p2  ORF type:complete len:295 (-),score=47.49 TRINITY_DN328_c1_g2_i19:172-954(-)
MYGGDMHSSVVFDLELEDEDGCIQVGLQADYVHNVIILIKNLISCTDVLEQKVRSDTAEIIKDMNDGNQMMRMNKDDLTNIGMGLKEYGHDVRMRTAEGGGAEYLRQLHYQFLYVVNKTVRKAYIIDPNFKSNFYISCASPQYKQILQSVPEVFVGQASQLKGLIRLLCTQVEKCFEDEGIYTPPWRKESAMLSKWFPTRRLDMDVSSQLGELQNKDSRTISPASTDSIASSYRMITGFNLDVAGCSQGSSRTNSAVLFN